MREAGKIVFALAIFAVVKFCSSSHLYSLLNIHNSHESRLSHQKGAVKNNLNNLSLFFVNEGKNTSGDKKSWEERDSTG